MKKLFKYLKGYGRETVLGPLFKLFEASLELVVPLVIAAIVDYGIGGGNHSYVLWMSLLLVLLGVVGLAFSVTAQYFAAKASVGFVTKLRHALFEHSQSLSYSDLDAIGTSTLITRMTTDTSRVQSGLNLALRLLLRSPFVVFGAMIMAFTVDAQSGTTFALTIPLLSVIVFGVMIITTPLYKRVQSGVDKILRRTRENLSGARVVRAFGKEEREAAAFRADNAALTAAQNRAGHISALMNPLTYVVINLGILALIYVGALRVEIGELTQGEVIALYNYMSQILVELIKLANLIITITKALASASRISAVLEVKPSQSYGNEAEGKDSRVAVEFSGVSLRYDNAGDDSLTGISFTAMRGETVGIIGGTGAGKSSLVNLIPRFYDATAGEVRVFGRPVGEYSSEAIGEMVGIVPQKAVLFSGSIRENMLWGDKSADDGEIMRAIRIAQAEGVVADKGGLDARVEAGGRNFSGGQRQRLTIARALVGSPDIIILDDSASALDYATDASLRRAIREMDGESTVFIVSQRAASVMHADKIVVLDDGQAVGIGTHSELLTGCAIYREIYESQFGGEVAANG